MAVVIPQSTYGFPVLTALASGGGGKSGKLQSDFPVVWSFPRTLGGSSSLAGEDGHDGSTLSLKDKNNHKRLQQALTCVGCRRRKGGTFLIQACGSELASSASEGPISALAFQTAWVGGGNDKSGCRALPGGSSPHVCTTRHHWQWRRRKHGKAVYATAQRQHVTDGTVAVPIDFYQVLGAQTHFLTDAIVRAYDARISNPPTEGFTEEGLATRLEILKLAKATLTDPGMREAYNQGLIEDEPGTLMVDIPWQKIPGTLCLLQEMGETDIVLELGPPASQKRLSKDGRCDLALCIALAHVELSRGLLSREPPAVVDACDGLRAALESLRSEEGVTIAPELQEQIESSVTQLMPACVIELLSLPLNEQYAARRKEGLEGLKGILWGSGGGGVADLPAVLPGGIQREQFISEAFGAMTAEEQVALFMSTPQHIPADSWEVYNACLAHVADGYLNKKPERIQDADMLLSQLQQSLSGSSSAGPSGAEGDDKVRQSTTWNLSLERAMCAMLLGRVATAKEMLGIENPDSPIEVSDVVAKKGGGVGSFDLENRAIREFVYEQSALVREREREESARAAAEDHARATTTEDHGKTPVGENASDSNSDGEESYDHLLPGLCILLAKWLQETVFPPFRDAAGQQVILDDYYDDEGVKRYLERLDRRSPLGAGEALAEAGKALRNVQRSAVETVKKVLSLGGPHEGQTTKEMGNNLVDKTGAESLEVGDADDWQEKPANQEVVGNLVRKDPRQGNPQEPGIAWLVKPLAFIVAGGLLYGGLVLMGLVRQPVSGGESRGRRFSTWLGGGNAAAVAETCAPSRTASISEVTRSGRALDDDIAAAIISEERDGQGVGSVREKQNEPIASQSMTPAVAERMVRRWQIVKARALGPTHHVEALKEVLEGPMLSLWSERAQNMAKHGWHWEYKLLNMKIDSIKIRDGGKSASVEATLQEAAQLHDNKKPDLNDSYRSTYSARYEMRIMPDKGWRISKGEVVIVMK
ncbi:hypothetical protein CBR_g40449 [Chara braunii]|uniref:Uncharacterized protein n=1 Tax=Chara braunii TaxID=69332 RepID=A0A388LTX6_CHABU|nr:hypothetical protein CBR_g40449 [Chara braunii]|eukprot:GBG85721.1 hypothetical protein CBR_g40449 [Chara braunii]